MELAKTENTSSVKDDYNEWIKRVMEKERFCLIRNTNCYIQIIRLCLYNDYAALDIIITDKLRKFIEIDYCEFKMTKMTMNK